MNTITINVVNTYARGAVISLISLLVLSFVYYGYLLQATIVHGADVENSGEFFSSLYSEIGDLEKQYIALKSDVTLNKALALGFVEAGTPLYISRAEEDTRLTLGTR